MLLSVYTVTTEMIYMCIQAYMCTQVSQIENLLPTHITIHMYAEIEEQLPMEQPKESKKAGKQMAALIKKREAEEKRRAEEQVLV